MAESNLTIEKATHIALAKETAVQNAKTLRSSLSKGNESGPTRSSASLHKVHQNSQGSKSNGKTSKSLGSAVDGISCYWCEQKSHKATQCQHKENICYYYNKVGHLKSVCQELKQAEKSAGTSLVKQVVVTASEPTESEYPLFKIGNCIAHPLQWK